MAFNLPLENMRQINVEPKRTPVKLRNTSIRITY